MSIVEVLLDVFMCVKCVESSVIKLMNLILKINITFIKVLVISFKVSVEIKKNIQVKRLLIVVMI